MRALVFDKSLRFEPHHPDPVAALGDTLIRVRRAGICSTDLEIVRGYMGFTGVLGHEFVGEVIASPRHELIGQRVVGEINCPCGTCDRCTTGLSNHCATRTVLGIYNRPGCFADLVRLPHENLHIIPATMEDEAAVFVEPLAAALAIPRQVHIGRRTWVTVLGDGRLGLLCAQVLRNVGAPVRMVGRNPNKLALCERWGIKSRLLKDITPKHDQDVVVDCTGSPEGLTTALAMCRPRGTLVLKSTFAAEKPLNLAPVVIDEITVVGSRCGPFAEAIEALDTRVVDVAPMITKRLRFEQAVEAMDLAGRKGTIKVVLTFP